MPLNMTLKQRVVAALVESVPLVEERLADTIDPQERVFLIRWLARVDQRLPHLRSNP